MFAKFDTVNRKKIKESKNLNHALYHHPLTVSFLSEGFLGSISLIIFMFHCFFQEVKNVPPVAKESFMKSGN